LETANFKENNYENTRNEEEYEEYYVEEEFKDDNQGTGVAPLRDTEIDKSRTSHSSILDGHLVHFNKFLE